MANFGHDYAERKQREMDPRQDPERRRGQFPEPVLTSHERAKLEQEVRDLLKSQTKPLLVIPKEAMVGVGGAPTRATTLPDSSEERKKYPIITGVLDYFPDAIAALAHLSWVGNDKHNPGQPLHWARGKSGDEADALGRHLLRRGLIDPSDGIRETVKVAWRALAMLQKELEEAQKEEAA